MNKFDQQIKDKLSAPQAPPLEAWKTIEQHIEPKRNRKIIPFYYWIAGAAACLGIFALFYNQDMDKNLIPGHKTVPMVQQKSNKNISPTENSNLGIGSKNTADDTEHYISNHSNDWSALDEGLAENKMKSSFIRHNEYDTPDSTNKNKALYDLWDDLAIMKTPLESNPAIAQHSNITISDTPHPPNTKEKREEESLEEILKKKSEVEKIKAIKEPRAQLMLASHYSPSLILNHRSVLTDTYLPEHIENQLAVNFGAKLSYAVTDRLRISTGIAKMNMNQQTTDVVATQTNILPLTTSSQQETSLVSSNIRYSKNIRLQNEISTLSEINVKKESGRIEHRIEFVEIPLDVSYTILRQKRWSVDALLGASMFLLSKNEISLSSSSYRHELIGTATNINESSLSTKTGVRLNYELTKELGIHLQPNYRVMWNTFENINQRSTSLFDFNVGISYKIFK
ncbi:hypothetical protein [Faecalibacter sp. LW9]|uniref:hypothetical protein n=1 Tax=Faecalibacter sp. LW9 TaxID=3103144 RepID=UPI002AFF1D80|nr:hypothetical protein [Faecalibacter sp. LW9]